MAKNSTEETIIAQGVRVEGEFVSQGDVYIEGEVNGNVQTSGDLRIGSNSIIHADVVASNAVVSGEIRGNVQITGRLDLLDSARVSGDVNCDVLSVAAGARINGKISMEEIQKKQKEDSDSKDEE